MRAVRALGVILGVVVATQAVARTVILLDLSQPLSLDRAALARLSGAGVVNDLLLVLLLAWPVVLLAALLPRWRISRAVLALLLGVLFCALLLGAAADVSFWFEFHTRADAFVCCAMPVPQVWRDVWRDPWLASATCAGITLLVIGASRASRGIADALLAAPRSHRAATVGVGMLLLGMSVDRNGELWMLRWPDAAPLDYAVSNGPLRLAHTASLRLNPASRDFAPLDETAAATLLGGAFARSATDYGEAARHLILIAVPAPAEGIERAALRSVRRSGVYFEHMYATGFGTQRLLEAVLHGMPPLPGAPRVVAHWPSLPGVLEDAGFAVLLLVNTASEPWFDAMRWQAPGATQVVTSASAAPDALLDTMDRRAHDPQRVFAVAPLATMESASTFIQRAVQRPWFDDTLIVLVATPAPHSSGTALIPVRSLNVPAVLIWGRNLRPRVATEIASTLDVARTALRVLDVDSDARFFGRDLLGIGAAAVVNVAPVEYDGACGIVTRAGVTVLMGAATPRFWRLGELSDEPGAATALNAQLARAIYAAAAQVAMDAQ